MPPSSEVLESRMEVEPQVGFVPQARLLSAAAADVKEAAVGIS